jgi:hypothetical protein
MMMYYVLYDTRTVPGRLYGMFCTVQYSYVQMYDCVLPYVHRQKSLQRWACSATSYRGSTPLASLPPLPFYGIPGTRTVLCIIDYVVPGTVSNPGYGSLFRYPIIRRTVVVMWRFLVPDVKPCHNSITYSIRKTFTSPRVHFLGNTLYKICCKNATMSSMIDIAADKLIGGNSRV